MTVEARAKINWTLQIVGRRDDGYHLLDSVMQHIDLSDTLVFEPTGDFFEELIAEGVLFSVIHFNIRLFR